MIPPEHLPPRESGSRRGRAACTRCGQPIEIGRLREHLRGEHQLDSATVEGLYLEGLVEVRRNRGARG